MPISWNLKSLQSHGFPGQPHNWSVIDGISLFFKIMLTMFLGLCWILHIRYMYSLLSFDIMMQCVWLFLTLFTRDILQKKIIYCFLFRICHYLNTKTKREKFGDIRSLWTCCVFEFAFFQLDGVYCTIIC